MLQEKYEMASERFHQTILLLRVIGAEPRRRWLLAGKEEVVKLKTASLILYTPWDRGRLS